MSRDEHGMPLPSKHTPQPWIIDGNYDLVDANGNVVAESVSSIIDSEFIEHAAKWIAPCREIVRRLAEATTKEVNPAESHRRIGYEAAKLWIQIQKGAGDE